MRRVGSVATVLTALVLLAPAGVAGAVSADAPAARPPAPEPALVDDQLVLAALDAGGLPTDVTLVTRVSATDLPEQVVRVPTSTTDLRYLDRPGAPPVSGDAMLVPVGGEGLSSVVTQASFDRPLPVALHAEYVADGSVVAPDTVPGRAGDLSVRYTVTNTVVDRTTVRYTDAAGTMRERSEPVFAPFAGSLVATLAPGTRLVSAPGGMVGTTTDGRASVRWELVLYPPVGDYTAAVELVVAGDDLRLPAVRMEVLPVTDAEDPAAGFASDLLSGSVDGSVDLADGLRAVDDSTVELAAGVAELTRGLESLQAGTAALDSAVDDQLVPGATAVARAADRLAGGQEDLTAGVTSAYTGAAGLTQGSTALAAALAQLDRGLAALAGADGLASARDASRQLTAAVDTLADAVGSPSDPVPDWSPEDGRPLPSSLTLVQASRALARAARALAAAAADLGRDVAVLIAPAADAASGAAGAAQDAGAAAGLVGQVLATACGPVPTLAPAQCTALASAAAKAGSAATSAAEAAQDAGDVATGLGAAARRAETVAIGAAAISLGLDRVAAAVGEVGAALRSRDPEDPGIYEGMVELTAGLRAASDAATALADGAARSVEGADRLEEGAADLTQGLGAAAGGSARLADGGAALAAGAQQQAAGTAEVADALGTLDSGVSDAADGSAALADGARRLHTEGTAEVLDGVVDSSRRPARAQAYLVATAAAAATAAPYPPPEGGVARVAYVSTIDPPEPVTGPGAATLALALVVGVALVLLAARRIAG